MGGEVEEAMEELIEFAEGLATPDESMENGVRWGMVSVWRDFRLHRDSFTLFRG